MAKYMLEISYTVKDGKRDEFVALAKELKKHFAEEMKKDYSIFEVKGRKNVFVEQFVCATAEEFDALEDNISERGEQLIQKLTSFIEEGGARYSTLIELQ